jgi:hypothetical protein
VAAAEVANAGGGGGGGPGVPADRLDDHERSIAAAESKECGNKYEDQQKIVDPKNCR